MQPSFVVAHRHRRSHQQGRRQLAIAQLVRGPGALAVAAPPGHQRAVEFDAQHQIGIAAEAGRRRRPACSTTSVPRAVSTQPTAAWKARAQTTVSWRDTPSDQIDQTLDVVRTARRSDRHFPAWAAVERIHAHQSARQADHQGVPDRHQHTGLAQHEGFARCASGSRGVGRSGRRRPLTRRSAPSTKTRAPATSGARIGWRRQTLAPEFASVLQGDQLVLARHDGRHLAILTDAGDERRADAGTPHHFTGTCVQQADGAVTGRHGHRVARRLHHQRET